MVKRCMAGTPASSTLHTGDIILSINGTIVTRFWDVESLVQIAPGNASLEVVVLRQQSEISLEVMPTRLPTIDTKRLLRFAGLSIIDSNLCVRSVGYLPPSGGVYICGQSKGSPADKYKVGCGTWITEVNGISTPDLDAFLGAVLKKKGDQNEAEAAMKLKTVSLMTQVRTITLRLEKHYWPLELLERDVFGSWHLTKPQAPLHGGCGAQKRDALDSPALHSAVEKGISEKKPRLVITDSSCDTEELLTASAQESTVK